jgi:hypothetical protein
MPTVPHPHRRRKRKYTKRTPPEHRRTKHPNWGGRRLGAGAPRGNLNALKHGRRSAQMARLGMILASQPETRAALLYLADSADRKQANLELFFERVMDQIFARGLKVGLDRLTGETRLMLLPPREDRRAIEKPVLRNEGATHGTPPTQTGEE